MKARALGLGLLVLVLHGGVAQAAPRGPVPSDDHAPTGAVGEAARARFSEGMKSYAKKRYDRALAAFLQAYALTKNAAILFNLGMTSLKLGDPLHALHYFEQFLHDSTTATPEQRARANVEIKEARQGLGTIDIIAPDGADIAVDGEPAGRAPLAAPIAALPGEHVITITTAAGAKLANIEVKAGMVARLKLVGSGPPPPPAGAVSGDEEHPESKRPPPAEPEAPGPFAPPETIAPVYVAGAIGLGALSAAIVLRGIGANADRNTSVSLDALGRSGKDASACTGTGEGSLEVTCGSLRSGQRASSAVKGPFVATLAIGAASTAFALGWYLFAPKSAPKVGTSGLIVTF